MWRYNTLCHLKMTSNYQAVPNIASQDRMHVRGFASARRSEESKHIQLADIVIVNCMAQELPAVSNSSEFEEVPNFWIKFWLVSSVSDLGKLPALM